MNIKFLFILWIGFIVLVLNFNCSLASAEIEELNCSNEIFSNIEPSFSLDIREKTPIIDPGENLELKIYISGYGGAKHNLTKLVVYFPIDLTDQYPTEDTFYCNNLRKLYDHFPIYCTDKNRTNNIGNYEFFPEKYNNTTIKRNLTYINDHTSFYFKFPTFYFDHIKSSDGICKIYAEDLIYDHKAPLIITINTTRVHIYGDRKIDFILYYNDGNRTYQNNQEVIFHINGWWEGWGITGTIIIVTILAFLLPLVPDIYSILKKFRVFLKNKLTRNKE